MVEIRVHLRMKTVTAVASLIREDPPYLLFPICLEPLLFPQQYIPLMPPLLPFLLHKATALATTFRAAPTPGPPMPSTAQTISSLDIKCQMLTQPMVPMSFHTTPSTAHTNTKLVIQCQILTQPMVPISLHTTAETNTNIGSPQVMVPISTPTT